MNRETQYRIVVERHDSMLLRWRWKVQWKTEFTWYDEQTGFAITRRIGLAWARHVYNAMQRDKRKWGSFVQMQKATRREIEL